MESDAGLNRSIWMQDVADIKRAPLTEDRIADVCIVGAGIAGLSCAYLLAREGKSVVVLDDGPVGGGQTSLTSGHLASAIDDRYYELEKLHGAKGARLAAKSHSSAIDLIGSIIEQEGIECDFRRVDGYLFLAPGDSQQVLEQELAAARRAGLQVERVMHPPVDSYDFGAALRFANQAEFHVMKYLRGLAKAIEKLGGVIHTDSKMQKISKGDVLRVQTAARKVVTAADVIVATNVPVNDRVVMHTKQAAYRSYVVAFQIEKGAVPHVLMWDTPDPYHYVRVAPASQSDKEWLIVGGEDHKTGQAPEDQRQPFDKLEQWARERFPISGTAGKRWSGQIIEPVDGLAFIGRNPLDSQHVYIATGDSGNGLTHGMIAGWLICDLVLGRENPWATLYDPARRRLRAAKEFAHENLNVAAQYSDLLTGGEIDSTEAIARGSGATVREGVHKIAAYRDEAGDLHRHSAICPHLGCVVEWNDIEKSWDCPCHGSRFDKADGHVLNGPAVSGLSEAEPSPSESKSGRRRASERPSEFDRRH